MITKEEAANLYKVLGDVNRLQIVKILYNLDEVCACKFLKCVKCGQSTLSFHLQTLLDAKLLSCRKDGKKVLYKVDKDKIKELMEFIYTPCANFNKWEFENEEK